MTNKNIEELMEEQTELITELSKKLSKKDFDKLIRITELEAKINIDKVKNLFEK